MAGQYTVEMLAIKFGEPAHEVRRALMASGVSIDLNDMVDVDAAEKADSRVKKFLDDHNKERAAAKQANANNDEAKAKWLAEHNAKVEKALADAGSWENLVASSASKGE